MPEEIKDKEAGVEKETSSEEKSTNEKYFTQEEVNSLLAKNKRNLQQENRALKERLEKTDLTLSEIKAEMEKSKNPPDEEQVPDTLEGKIELMEKRHQRALEEYQKKLDNLEAEKTQERTKRLEKERDTEILNALQEAGCIDHTGGMRYALPQVEWDNTEQKWIFKTKSGNFVSILDGVTEELPDYLKSPQMNSGGSGIGSGSPRKQAKIRELDDAKKKLEGFQQQAEKSGRSDHIQLYRQQKKVVAQLEASLSKT
jgi:hypothetical protein